MSSVALGKGGGGPGEELGEEGAEDCVVDLEDEGDCQCEELGLEGGDVGGTVERSVGADVVPEIEAGENATVDSWGGAGNGALGVGVYERAEDVEVVVGSLCMLVM